MGKRIYITLVAFIVVGWPIIALGADSTSSASDELIKWLVGLIASIVLLVIQHAVRKWLAPKVSKETAELLDKIAEAGVRYAEEKGRDALKTTGQKMASAEKLERALSHVLIEADKFGLKDLAKERATKYVESALSKTREAPVVAAPAPVPMDTQGKVKGV